MICLNAHSSAVVTDVENKITPHQTVIGPDKKVLPG